MTSYDGVTWTARSATLMNSWQSVCYAQDKGILVAVSNTGTGANRVMTSSYYAHTHTLAEAGIWAGTVASEPSAVIPTGSLIITY